MRKLANREKKGLKQMGARQTINSGASLQDGDGRRKFNCKLGMNDYNALFIEWKATNKKSFSVTKDILEKARVQAQANDDLPVLVVDLPFDKIVVLSYDDFMDLLEDYERNRVPNDEREYGT